MQNAPVSPARARTHRKTMTPSEATLWRVVRAKRFKGLHFRRQHPFGPYILDFYCDAAKLAVEVDGGIHQLEERMMQDAARDAWVTQRGVRTLRLPARLVLEDIDAALELIGAELGWRGPAYRFG
ncbi:MAG: endonuclease domain-containing protein [Caulobacter sp.]|nr:endonuclease domain-containing protein [Caulobacter sp.]